LEMECETNKTEITNYIDFIFGRKIKDHQILATNS